MTTVIDLCGQALCTNVATHVMYWPGSQPSYVCAHHRARAENVAKAMGFELVFEPVKKSVGA
jgi:hypothetical protein